MRVRLPLMVALLLLPGPVGAQTAPVEGLRENPPRVHALTGARIVVAPGRVIPSGVLVIRNGVVEAVGSKVSVPADARVWDLSGRTLYPGFIDAYSSVGMRTEVVPADTAQSGSAGWNPQLRSAADAVSSYAGGDDADRSALRAQGITVVNAVPQLGLFRGQTAVMSLGDGRVADRVIRPKVAQAVTFWSDSRLGRTYPSTRMGAMAFIRQTLHDADWYARARAAYERDPGGVPRPEVSAELAALGAVLRREQPIIFSGSAGEEEVLRALGLREEFPINAWILGSGGEHHILGALRGLDVPLLLPVNFPEPRFVSREGTLDAELDMLRDWHLAPENPARLAAAGVRFALTVHGLYDAARFLPNVRTAVRRGLSPEVALAALTTVPADYLGISETHGTLETGRAANVVVASGDLFTGGDARVEAVFVDGERFAVAAAARGASRADGDGPPPSLESAASWPVMPYGRAGNPEQPRHVLVRNATVWTMGPQGTLKDADLLVERGRVVRVGRDLDAPAGALVIDGTGRHVTPGLIDPHHHSHVTFHTSEMIGAVVPEVRIGDMLTSRSEWMYRQLAGGLTTALVMHGSASPIGGQNQTIKLRWGASPAGLKVEGAPRSIKFALGENAKRLSSRYPTTRMGTEQIIRDNLLAAREYERRWKAWERAPRGIPPRRDLRMDALVDVLNGDLLVMVHAYRQDDMLTLMRLAEEFGFRIRAFHHAVEAYKIAPELAAHGAAAAVWSDWSSFMMEAYDATTFNARLLMEAGVLTSLHADDAEVASRMNWEAAKTLRTGLTEEEALALITINPARLLGVDGRVGSLEAGKDADFVIWSANPLSTLARAEQTWIDGRRYFDIGEDLRLREQVERDRERIIDLILPPSPKSTQAAAPAAGQRGGLR